MRPSIWHSPTFALAFTLLAGTPLAAAFASGCAADATAQGRVDVGPPASAVGFATFDTVLTPFGDWLFVDGHRVWRPSVAVVGADFVPYATNGQWLDTEAGWSFQSDFDWGWATFHYGRWFDDPAHGWVWLPGDAWAPAWVDWRDGGAYVGWAPMPPVWFTATPRWVFCDRHDLGRPHISAFLVGHERVPHIVLHSRPVVGTHGGWSRGPIAHVGHVGHPRRH